MVKPWEVHYHYSLATYIYQNGERDFLFLKGLYFIAVMLTTSTIEEGSLGMMRCLNS